MEMNIVSVTNGNTTGNKKLDHAITVINNELKRGIKASHSIALQLEKIKNEELYTVNSDSFSDFCENWFGISKSQASRLTQVAEKFLHEKVIDEENGKEYCLYDSYTTSKLVEMLKASDEQLAQITPDMKVLEIRAFIKGESMIEDKNGNDEESDNTSNNSKSKKTKKTKKFDVDELINRINSIDIFEMVQQYKINDDVSSTEKGIYESALKKVLSIIDEIKEG